MSRTFFTIICLTKYNQKPIQRNDQFVTRAPVHLHYIWQQTPKFFGLLGPNFILENIELCYVEECTCIPDAER